ncbi:hypothetical protein SeMB42_g03231 [Synchytrium endobioticum]|uniref:Secretory carrier membrane protein n=1 Tax=Synchytrium endobioticum TaxID=286115 RepID=A0A507D8G4_9FUNG|nr:hypothetical protein SeMB42_g03231 [Synchytrium endobioticum]
MSHNFVPLHSPDDDLFDDSYRAEPPTAPLTASNYPPFNPTTTSSSRPIPKSSLMTTPFTSPPHPQTFAPSYSSSAYPKPHVQSSASPASHSNMGVDLGSIPDSLAMAEEILRRKEAELAARERLLLQQQAHLSRAGATSKPPNWPPFYPLVHHDIAQDIPEQHQKTVTKIWYLWLATVAELVWNMIACLAILISHPPTLANTAADFGVALVYIFTITAASFFLWNRPAYLAFSKNSSFFYFVFFVFLSCHICFCYYMAVGIPGSGAAGFINALGALTGGAVGTFVLCLIALIGWIMLGTYSLWTFREVYTYYTAGGHSFEKAKSEAIQIGVANPTVQGAAAGAASSYLNGSAHV